MKLILGSSSPRRLEIMNFFSYPFEQESPPCDESSVPFKGSPSQYVMDLAKLKVDSLLSSHPRACILTFDTIVYFEGEILGKPKNKKHAVDMLTRLSSRWHSVFTGVGVHYKDETLLSFEETKVHFNTLSPDDIQRYLNANHFLDKAGAYAIQKAGALLIKEIAGCYYNVMGAPINTVRKLLSLVGIDLWDHLKRERDA